MIPHNRPTTPEIHQAAVIAAQRCAATIEKQLLPEQTARTVTGFYAIIREMLEAFHARKEVR